MYVHETADGACYELLKAYADYHKNHPTEAESIMWEFLKDKQLYGHQFHRQHIINDYIADFVNLHRKLVVEVDGQYHLEGKQIVKDKSRTEDLQRQGFTIIRFTNEEVIASPAQVLNTIKKQLMEIIPPKSNTTKKSSSPREETPYASPLPLEEVGGRLLAAGVHPDAWAVDAACSGNPGPMEYQAVDLQTGQRVFHFGPMHGTNNIGEFLAIVHALALCWQRGLTTKTIYSDSYNAILWVKKRQCKTKLERNAQTEPLYEIIERAELWLRTHDYHNPILKWETQKWGEVPADFGRK